MHLEGGVCKYLGVKMSGKCLQMFDLSDLMDTVLQRLTLWKAFHLSLSGQVTLINSVLLPIHVYAISNTWVPNLTLLAIKRMCCNFLSGVERFMQLLRISLPNQSPREVLGSMIW